MKGFKFGQWSVLRSALLLIDYWGLYNPMYAGLSLSIMGIFDQAIERIDNSNLILNSSPQS